MARLLLVLIVALTSIGATMPLSPLIERSIVRLEAPQGTYCTGFVIDTAKGYVLTADHCIQGYPNPIINGLTAEEIFYVPQLDIAVLKAPGVLGLPALKARTKVWDEGMKITFYGYAAGLELKVIKGSVLLPLMLSPGIDTPSALMKPAIEKGMSGGPVLDSEGMVVAINQKTFPGVGLAVGVPAPIIKAYVEDYWPD